MRIDPPRRTEVKRGSRWYPILGNAGAGGAARRVSAKVNAPSLLFNGRRRMLEAALLTVEADEDVVGTSRVRELERRVRELERLLGRKTMEVEIWKRLMDVARVKKPILQLPSWNDRKDGSP